jgi:hypothetical protein
MRIRSLLAMVAAAAGTLMVGAVGQPPAIAAGGLVQPSGATFAVAFPSPTFRVDNDRPDVLAQFPGAMSAAAYYETQDTYDIIDPSTPVPHAPTYVVATAAFPSPEAAEHYVNLVSTGPGMKPVLVGSVAGYHVLAREDSAINKHNVISQPHAFESLLSVSQGNTVYLALAVTTKARAAQAFTRSLRLTGTPATGPAPGLATEPVQPNTATPKSSAYKDGELFGYALAALLVVAIIIKVAGRPRRGNATYPPHPQHVVPGTPEPSSQFGWMYQGAPAPTETTAAPPPPPNPTRWDPPPL